MDESTLSDIRQRVARWQKGDKKDKPEDPKTWIFAVNIDDVQMLLDIIEHHEKEIEELRLQLFQAREQLAYNPADQPFKVKLDASALEPGEQPDGQMKHFFNIYSGPYQMPDTLYERQCTWSRGPFASWKEANEAWKDYCKRQKENGQP